LTDIQTVGQTERWTNINFDIQMNIQKNRQTENWTDRRRNTQTESGIERRKNRQIESWTNRRRNKKTERLVDIQTDEFTASCHYILKLA
jgi:hypothetical protein